MKGNSKREKSIIILRFFSEWVREDLTSFLENLIVDAKANEWNKQNLFEVIKGFLKDDILENGI